MELNKAFEIGTRVECGQAVSPEEMAEALIKLKEEYKSLFDKLCVADYDNGKLSEENLELSVVDD